VASDISEELRAEVALRAGDRCEYCLIHEADAGFPYQVHHIVSRKHLGFLKSLNRIWYALHLPKVDVCGKPS